MAAVTVGELRSLVERFAAALEANKADRAAVRSLRDLCGMFDECEKRTVVDFFAIAGRASIPTAPQPRPSVPLSCLRLQVCALSRTNS